ncbi:Oxidoreductase andH [Colletotrichum siamense]|uniref:Oxidoreductase andH n=1 Tax=Colletotrichum siamense TaxID=690259 RepID=UPI001872922A|nr:Oxidoreductase andH [Colletotrichum siamense]KAF5489300.1 Oxidoreductase andH [Colletotrichum siamense]
MVSLTEVRASNAALTSSSVPKTALFVGATSGIGKYTLTELVSLNLPIKCYVVGRKASEPAMRPVLEALRLKNTQAELVWVEAEVSLLSEVKRVCEFIKENEERLICYTGEGIEVTHALQYYGRMLFTLSLLPLLRASPSPRVLTVLGGSFLSTNLLVDDLDLRKAGNFGGMRSQTHMSIMNTLFLDRLASDPENAKITFVHNWPGAVDTGNMARYHAPSWLSPAPILLKFCDVQLLTGFGLLFSSFVGLTCYMSAYHWQIISYLAWFSALTHAACLTALREYLYHHQMERNFRMILMIILLVGLIIAIWPTGYFNWDARLVETQGTASVPTSNARCFFSQKSIQSAWEGRLCGQIGGSDKYHCNFKEDEYGRELKPSATTAYDSSILSIVLLIFSFFTRSVKMFRALSKMTKKTIRQKLGHWAASCLTATARRYPHFGTTALRRKLLSVFRPLDVMVALYLVVKLYLDVLLSEMSDIFWLLISSLWGTARLFMARGSADVLGAENEWGFGQVLAVFLLLGPITAVCLALFATIRRQRKSRKKLAGEHEDSITHAVSLLASYRAGN